MASTKDEFSVSVQPNDYGWVVHVHDGQGDRILLDLESKAAAVFDAIAAAEQRLLALGVEHFEVAELEKEDGYDEWLLAEIQEALDDPSPLIPHEEAMRQILATIKEK